MTVAVNWWVSGDAADKERIRILIGKANCRFRAELRRTLTAAQDLEVVGETDDGELTLWLRRRLRPNVPLLDEDLPSYGRAAIARLLASELPEVRVIVLTGAG